VHFYKSFLFSSEKINYKTGLLFYMKYLKNQNQNRNNHSFFNKKTGYLNLNEIKYKKTQKKGCIKKCTLYNDRHSLIIGINCITAIDNSSLKKTNNYLTKSVDMADVVV